MMAGNLMGQSLGRYHIVEQLGRGGMAVVYKAYDMRLESDVAVKVLRRGVWTGGGIHGGMNFDVKTGILTMRRDMMGIKRQRR